MRPWLFLLLLGGCADITPIENGKAYGPVVSLIDLFTSCQLLETSEGPVLFDACWREGELAARLGERGHAPAEVVAVLMTHGHADHVGGLKSLTGAVVHALPAEQEVLTDKAGEAGKIDRPLADGEVLRFGEHEVRVLAVPGHTPGSAVYLVGGTLILGDAALITARGELAPAPEDRSEDPKKAVRSLVALSDRLVAEGREVKWLLPAHSGGVEGRQALEAFAAANR